MLGWALGALALLWRRVTSALRRAAFVFVMVLAALLALILVESLSDALPRLLAQIQYPYRLNTYVALAIAGLVLITVMATENAGGRAQRRLALALALATSITLATCAWQLFFPATGHHDVHVQDALVSPNRAPATWYNGVAYLDTSARVVPYPPTPAAEDRPLGSARQPRHAHAHPACGSAAVRNDDGSGTGDRRIARPPMARAHASASPSPAVPTVAAVPVHVTSRPADLGYSRYLGHAAGAVRVSATHRAGGLARGATSASSGSPAVGCQSPLPTWI